MTAPVPVEKNKFSGHESFVIRYGWLPKLYDAVNKRPALFASDEIAILELGLGKNMVKSIRFWGDALQLIQPSEGGLSTTPLAARLLDPIDGRDPYVEDVGTLWRLHWILCAHGRLGAWVTAFMELRDTAVTRPRLVSMVLNQARATGSTITESTASAHVDILLRTYCGGRQDDRAVVEDALGSPLQELDLMREESVLGVPTIKIMRGPKPTLATPDFAFALHDFWMRTAPRSKTLSLRSMMLTKKSLGLIFALDEPGLHERLGAVCLDTGAFELQEDGAGGVDLLATRDDSLDRLEALAW